MRATEVIKELQKLVDKYGDHDVRYYNDGSRLDDSLVERIQYDYKGRTEDNERFVLI